MDIKDPVYSRNINSIDMKKIIQYMLVAAVLIVVNTACDDDYDNYDKPDASISGIVIDITTGKGISTEQPNGFRIRWTEQSWGDNVQPDYFWGMPDGRFNFTHVFGYNDSKYEIVPQEGAFIEPEPQVVNIKSGEHKELTFEVVPYAHIEAGYELNGKELTVRYTVTHPDESPYAINAIHFLGSSKTQYVGFITTGGLENAFSKYWLTIREGTELSFKMSLENPGTYYFRFAVGTANPAGRYNYSPVEKIVVQ
jgi:hypothetical protein